MYKTMLVALLVGVVAACGQSSNSQKNTAPKAREKVPTAQGAFTPDQLMSAEVSVAVWSPKGKLSFTRFKLSAQELTQLRKHLPTLRSKPEHDCDCGVPRFGIDLEYSGQKKLSGHFFHGPDKLKVRFPSKKAALIAGTAPMHGYLKGLIEARGLWKKSTQ